VAAQLTAFREGLSSVSKKEMFYLRVLWPGRLSCLRFSTQNASVWVPGVMVITIDVQC
jgi:hypothetical protein